MVILSMEINEARKECGRSGVVFSFKKDGQGMCYRESDTREGASLTEGTAVQGPRERNMPGCSRITEQANVIGAE